MIVSVWVGVCFDIFVVIVRLYSRRGVAGTGETFNGGVGLSMGTTGPPRVLVLGVDTIQVSMCLNTGSVFFTRFGVL